MRKPERTTGTYQGEAGFSLIELLIVVGIIVIMSAVALPNIIEFLKTYKIKGATQQVAGQIQAARTKAVMQNTNNGVTFVIVDANSYRFIREDVALPDMLSPPLYDLPRGVRFQAGPDQFIRFNRLGNWCKPLSSTQCPIVAGGGPPPPWCLAGEGTRCTDDAPGPYMIVDPTAGASITLVETTTGMTRWVRVAPGGRVMTQP